VLAAGVVATVEGVLKPAAVESLWQSCLALSPEIAVGAAAAKVKSATVAAIVTGIIAAGLVVGGGVMAIQYANNSQPVAPAGETMTVTSQQSMFVPDFVSIDYTSSNPARPETYNPIYAELVLSEGTPVEWLIRDSNDHVVVTGTGWFIEGAYFAGLEIGVYQVEWVVENDEGNWGIAYKVFTVEDDSN